VGRGQQWGWGTTGGGIGGNIVGVGGS
jgi:hypothetical protein